MKRTKTITRYSCISEAYDRLDGPEKEFAKTRMEQCAKDPEQTPVRHVTERPEFKEALAALGNGRTRRTHRTKKSVS